jgi:hypothetical protein
MTLFEVATFSQTEEPLTDPSLLDNPIPDGYFEGGAFGVEQVPYTQYFYRGYDLLAAVTLESVSIQTSVPPNGPLVEYFGPDGTTPVDFLFSTVSIGVGYTGSAAPGTNVYTNPTFGNIASTVVNGLFNLYLGLYGVVYQWIRQTQPYGTPTYLNIDPGGIRGSVPIPGLLFSADAPAIAGANITIPNNAATALLPFDVAQHGDGGMLQILFNNTPVWEDNLSSSSPTINNASICGVRCIKFGGANGRTQL